ncbi:MAG TPA: hypothetical protein VGK24_06190 [Candidatus Angelobacter sp.]|jgi:hypothetical protein
MESSSAVRAFDFPPLINQTEIENLGVARNTVLFRAGATLLAAYFDSIKVSHSLAKRSSFFNILLLNLLLG